MKMKNIILITLLSIIGILSYGQDIHFSQFYITPLNVNPAAAGTYHGDYRGVINFKEQFSSFSNAYRTVNLAFDKPIVKKRRDQKVTGAGINVFQDIAGDSKTKTFHIDLNLSQTIQFASYADLSLGIQVGYTQFSTNLVGLSWDNQFNGLRYDSELSPREDVLFMSQDFFDFSAGLLYRYFDYDGFPLEIGGAVYHLNRPEIGLNTSIFSERLPMKFIVHAKKEFELYNDRFGLVPMLFLAKQAGAQEMTGGLMVRYDAGLHSKYTGYHKQTTLYMGVLYRHFDAIIPQFLVNLEEKYTLGISYDVNISNLVAGSRYKGGFEVSLSMSGFFNERYRVISPVTF